MPPAQTAHAREVDAWMERVAAGASPERLVQAFEEGWGALLARARLTLGDITLSAIVDRVLYTASERYPSLFASAYEASGPCFEELRARAAGVPDAGLRDAFRFVLVEFLTVLGNLTADILTPALHRALSRAGRASGGSGEGTAS